MVYASLEDSSERNDFELVVGDNTQVEKAPAAAQPEKRAAGDMQGRETPGVATQDEPAAVHVEVEDAPGATEHVPFTSAFHVEKVKPLPVGSTTAFIDSEALRQMVRTDSRISQHVVETSDRNVCIRVSRSTSSATKEGTLKFGIRNVQDKLLPVAFEVLVVHFQGAYHFSVGALAEKGVKCDLFDSSGSLPGRELYLLRRTCRGRTMSTLSCMM